MLIPKLLRITELSSVEAKEKLIKIFFFSESGASAEISDDIILFAARVLLFKVRPSAVGGAIGAPRWDLCVRRLVLLYCWPFASSTVVT